MTTTTSNTETVNPVTPADVEAAIVRRLNRILYHTPQRRTINTHLATLDAVIAEVERVLTKDLPDLMEETRLHAVRVVELETERRTVRAYFGVSEATA